MTNYYDGNDDVWSNNRPLTDAWPVLVDVDVSIHLGEIYRLVTSHCGIFYMGLLTSVASGKNKFLLGDRLEESSPKNFITKLTNLVVLISFTRLI